MSAQLGTPQCVSHHRMRLGVASEKHAALERKVTEAHSCGCRPGSHAEHGDSKYGAVMCKPGGRQDTVS